MIVKNEEKYLGRCLDSVKNIVDEMVIVDTGSSDSTVEIAQSFGARVYHYEWNDSFADARNFALSKATKDWILIMDADDELERTDTGKITTVINSGIRANACYMKTLCYCGEVLDENNIVLNLNIRLIRNFVGYKFKGRIHEQIVPSRKDVETGNNALTFDNIRFYHYGYLRDVIFEQDKRRRNIRLIEKELEGNPENCIMLFYLGNEYYAMLNCIQAKEYYQKSYALLDKKSTLGTKILLKLVMCCQMLGQFNEELKYLKEGFKLYPDFTDFEFTYANLLVMQKKPLSAIRSLNKCIKSGNPPPIIANIAGVGTFRPHFLLSEIYGSLGNCSSAVLHAKKAVSYTKSNPAVLKRLLQAYMGSGASPSKIRAVFSRICDGSDAQQYLLVSNIFYDTGRYGDALYFARKASRCSPGADFATAEYDKGACLFHLARFTAARKAFKNTINTPYAAKSAFLSGLCGVFLNSRVRRNIILQDLTNPYNEVFYVFCHLLKGCACKALAIDQDDSAKYIKPIFDLLRILLELGRFNEFEKAVKLLNLVEDDSVLLRLAKIYYANGLYISAYGEFIRSIKLTGKIDAESLGMMKKIMETGKYK